MSRPPGSSHKASRASRSGVEFALAAQMIGASDRPILYVGGGVVKARAATLLQRFAERHSIPVTTSLMAMGASPHDHPLNLGMLGMHGARSTHHTIERCDLL